MDQEGGGKSLAHFSQRNNMHPVTAAQSRNEIDPDLSLVTGHSQAVVRSS